MSRHVLGKVTVSLFLTVVLVFVSGFVPFTAPQTEATIKEIIGVGGDYTDNAYVAKRLDKVFEEFPVGSYFSYTGKPCTCHNKCSYVGGCECISDYNDPEKDGELVRLYSCQCMGFAHYMFYKLFGFVDRAQNYPETAEKYYSLGSLKKSEMTVENVKKLFKDVKTGANVRTTGKHSFIVLSTDQNGMYIYHANTGIPCRVDCWYWTWEEFTATYKNYGVEYIHMPTEYPESDGEYVPPTVPGGSDETTPRVGEIRVNADVGLRLRGTPSTDGAVLDLIPHTTLLTVTEISGGWGKVTYEGKIGWVFLQYTLPVLGISLPEERCYAYAHIPPDLSEMKVTLLKEDLTKTLLEKTDYTLTYSAPSEGRYPVTVTYGEHSAILSLPVLPFGDLNGDGVVSAVDASLLTWAASGELTLTLRQKEGADLTGDGVIDNADALAVVNYLTGKAALPTPKSKEE